MARISRVGHIVLYVSDVEAAVPFYRDVLGMELVRRAGNNAFMSFGTQHHDIGLFQVKGEASRGNLGLSHAALVIEGGMAELEEFHQRLVAHGLEVRLTDHGMTKSMYFRDPDGNRLEIYCDVMGPEEGKQFLAERMGEAKPFSFQEAKTAATGR
jgi:catechol 2,3-dioxygenase